MAIVVLAGARHNLKNTLGRTRAVLAALGFVVAMNAEGFAQETDHLFAPLIADPKQPHFFAAWLWIKSPMLTGEVASIGLGEDLVLASGGNGRWELSVAAGVFSQFNMRTPSNDLINTDFTGGLPFAYRLGSLSLRMKVYHQSSHLGDEFILATSPTRVNLSFEAVEVLAAREFGDVRGYAGGEYIVRHEPDDLKPALLHAGIEFRQPGMGKASRTGRLILAVDAKSSQERNWRVGWSGRLGWEFHVAVGATRVRPFSVQLQGYTGPAPYGQFYQETVRTLGAGIHLSL